MKSSGNNHMHEEQKSVISKSVATCA